MARILPYQRQPYQRQPHHQHSNQQQPNQRQPVQYPRQPDQPALPSPPWWRPLTRWWGILGVIVFIGLVMWLIDSAGFQLAQPPAPVRQRTAS